MLQRLLQEIRRLMIASVGSQVTHIYREANMFVDTLANLAGESEEDFLMLDQSLASVQQLLWVDFIGVSTPHVILG